MTDDAQPIMPGLLCVADYMRQGLSVTQAFDRAAVVDAGLPAEWVVRTRPGPSTMRAVEKSLENGADVLEDNQQTLGELDE